MKVWPIDPLGPESFRPEVPEKLPQGSTYINLCKLNRRQRKIQEQLLIWNEEDIRFSNMSALQPFPIPDVFQNYCQWPNGPKFRLDMNFEHRWEVKDYFIKHPEDARRCIESIHSTLWEG